MPNPDLNNTHFKFIYVNPFNAISIRKCLSVQQQQLSVLGVNVVFYPSRLHIFAAVRALCCYCCGGATPRAYKVMLLSTVGGLLVP